MFDETLAGGRRVVYYRAVSHAACSIIVDPDDPELLSYKVNKMESSIIILMLNIMHLGTSLCASRT